ncbi:MAG: MarR family transcriptional regulator [Bacillota bacterium]|nr:MarR family transcriptional regulator [Bacillota bacterium]
MDELSGGISIFGRMKKIMHTIRNTMELHFNDVSLTGPQGMLIGTLMHYDSMKISDLSEKLGLSNSTVSGILDRLEKQGLVERTRSKEDRRVVYVNIAPEFRKNAKEKYKELEQKFESMLSKATPEEIETINQGLETLQKIIERQKSDKE